jgi:hypothetical protein
MTSPKFVFKRDIRALAPHLVSIPIDGSERHLRIWMRFDYGGKRLRVVALSLEGGGENL